MKSFKETFLTEKKDEDQSIVISKSAYVEVGETDNEYNFNLTVLGVNVLNMSISKNDGSVEKYTVEESDIKDLAKKVKEEMTDKE